MKKAILFIMFALTLIGCGNSGPPPLTPSPSDAKWDKVRHWTAINQIWDIGSTRPQEHQTRCGSKIYYNGEVSEWEKENVCKGLEQMFAGCNRNLNKFTPPDAWTRFTRVTKPADIPVILVNANVRAESENIRDCPIMRLNNPSPEIYTCGTMTGVTLVDGYWGNEGGVYLLVPKQDRPGNGQCEELWTRCIKHEGEHMWALNDNTLFDQTRNDFEGNHPICRNIEDPPS